MSDPVKEKLFKSYKICVDNKMSNEAEDGEIEELSSGSETDGSSSSGSSSSSDSEEGELSDDSEDVEVNVVVGPEAEVDALDGRVSNVNTLSIKPLNIKNIESQKAFAVGRFEEHRQPSTFDEEDHEFGDDFEECIKDDLALEVTDPMFKKDVRLLLKSLDLMEDDFIRGGWRSEAICMRGIERLSPKDIFNYFKDFSPESIEWINNNSCNVLWPDKIGPLKALIGLSCPIKPAPKIAPIAKDKRMTNIGKSNILPIKGKSSSGSSMSKIQKKTRKDSDDSSTDSSSSDSDDSDSSSDSDGSSSSGSSSSSDSSDSSDDESVKAIKKNRNFPEPMEDTVALPPNFKPGKSLESNSDNGRKSRLSAPDDSMAMEVDGVYEDPEQGSMTWEEIGIRPIPSGRWRLGVPCINTTAILMRFAHCKEKKDPAMLEKPLDTYNEVFGIEVKRFSDRFKRFGSPSRKKFQQSNKFPPNIGRFPPPEFRLFPNLGKRPQSREMSGFFRPNDSRPHPSLRGGPSEFQDRISSGPPPPESKPGYQDLDNPFDESKNPWGFLSENWSNKATQETLDYRSLLFEHMTGEKKRKRPANSDLDSDGTEYSHRNGMRRSNKKVRRRRDEESDGSGTDNSMKWKSKIKLPRMRMYADSEEKKTRKIVKRTSVRNRIGLEDEWRSNVGMGRPPQRREMEEYMPPQRRRAVKARRSFGERNNREDMQSRLVDTRRMS